MLSLIRDFFKSTLLFYKNLYISTSTYGIRKELNSNRYKEELRSDIAELENSIKLAESEVTALNNKIQLKASEFNTKNTVY